tara:strand:+ start:3579 stop:4151 length:573 start_codon:yes stop_codon:yes gene_type:complete
MSYPTDPEFANVEITSRHANLRTETRSGRTQVRSLGAQRWAIKGRYNDLKRSEFAPVFAFVMAQKGGVEEFTIVPPVVSNTQGTASGAAQSSASHSAGDNTVSVDGLTGTIKAGDFVKFASHDKVYMLTAERSGSGVMTIQPPLVQAIPNNDALTYNSVPFKVRLENDIQEWSLSGFDKYNFEIDLIEVL